MRSRRWLPGDLAFQGGTSLHLAHGSPRFSEDLDFMIDESLSMDSLVKSVASRLAAADWAPSDMSVGVSRSRLDKNPASFLVSVSGEGVMGSVKVKTELWKTPRDQMERIDAVVSHIAMPRHGVETYVPTESLAAIYADKVFALGARPRLKARDVFDLHWLRQERGFDMGCLTPESLAERFKIYPNADAGEWVRQSMERADALERGDHAASILNDLSFEP